MDFTSGLSADGDQIALVQIGSLQLPDLSLLVNMMGTLGWTSLVQHEIPVVDIGSVWQQYYHLPYHS